MGVEVGGAETLCCEDSYEYTGSEKAEVVSCVAVGAAPVGEENGDAGGV